MKLSPFILPLAMLAACAEFDAGDAACNAWLDGRGPAIAPGSANYDSCLSSARHREELRRDKRSQGSA